MCVYGVCTLWVNKMSSHMKQCAIKRALRKTGISSKSLEVFMPVVRMSLNTVVANVAFRFVVCCVSLFDLVFALYVSASLSPAVQHVVR